MNTPYKHLFLVVMSFTIFLSVFSGTAQSIHLYASSEDGAVRLRWNATPDSTRRQFAVLKDFGPHRVGTYFVGPNVSEYTDTNVVNGQTYRYSVLSYDDDPKYVNSNGAYCTPERDFGRKMIFPLVLTTNPNDRPTTSITVSAGSNGPILIKSIGTIEFWVRLSSPLTVNGYHQTIISKLIQNAGLEIYHNADVLMARIQNPNKANYLNSGINLADSAWHHVALTYELGGTSTLYVDGQAVATTTTTPVVYYRTRSFLIGGRQTDGWSQLEGELDALRFWHVIRTPSEIAENRHHRLSGFEPGLDANFRFDRKVYIPHDDVDLVVDGPLGGRVIARNWGRNKYARHTVNVGNYKSVALDDGSIVVDANTSLMPPDVTSVTFTRTPVGTGNPMVLSENLDIQSLFPYVDQNVNAGVAYEYKLEVTRTLQADLSREDISVPASGLGTYYHFDGYNDGIRTNEAIINDAEGTVEFLLKINPEDRPFRVDYGLFGKHGVASRGGFTINHDGASIWSQFKDNDGNTSNLYPLHQPTNLADGQWHHVALTYRVADTARLYVDGTLLMAKAIPDFTFAPDQLFIGKSPNSYWKPLRGSMDEVVVWDQILTAQEIGERAFTKVRGDANGLLACYHLDESSGTTVYDDGLLNKHATNSGATPGQSRSIAGRSARSSATPKNEARAEVLTEELQQSLQVYGGTDQLTVRYPSTEWEEVLIYNLGGLVQFHQSVKFDGEATLHPGLERNQLYILRVRNEAFKFIIK